MNSPFSKVRSCHLNRGKIKGIQIIGNPYIFYIYRFQIYQQTTEFPTYIIFSGDKSTRLCSIQGMFHPSKIVLASCHGSVVANDVHFSSRVRQQQQCLTAGGEFLQTESTRNLEIRSDVRVQFTERVWYDAFIKMVSQSQENDKGCHVKERLCIRAKNGKISNIRFLWLKPDVSSLAKKHQNHRNQNSNCTICTTSSLRFI